jgi:photosystem II stability/assembly factor-like uncharacterized protein
VNADTIWASGAAALRSSNGGATWDSAKGITGGICFLDDSTGINSSGISGGMINRTTDGGNTWTQIQSINTLFGSVQKMLFIGEDSGWIADLGGNIYRTTDQGADWVLSNFDTQTGAHMHGGLTFFDSKHGYMAGDQAYWPPQPTWPAATSFARTTDGGANWHVIYAGDTLDKLHTGVYGAATAIGASSIDTLVVGGDRMIARSTDAGNTWDTITSPVNLSDYLILGICFPDRTHGTAVGAPGLILHTTDAGLTWVQQYSGVSVYLYAVEFLDTLNGYAVGDGGTILTTTNGGLSWVNISPLYSNSIKGTIYPQPSSENTTIAYSLPEAQHVSLFLSNVTGAKVSNPLSESLQLPGIQDVTIDTSQLASGTYTYVLQTEKYSSTGKIIVIH